MSERVVSQQHVAHTHTGNAPASALAASQILIAEQAAAWLSDCGYPTSGRCRAPGLLLVGVGGWRLGFGGGGRGFIIIKNGGGGVWLWWGGVGEGREGVATI